MHNIGLTQSSGMIKNLQNKVINAPVNYNYNCHRNMYTGEYECGYGRSYNFWFTPTYSNLSVETPFEYDADVYGGDAGVDVMLGNNSRVGLFASYRQGVYDLKGKGKDYKVAGSSEVDMDSYIGGLYYDYERGNFWALASVFGGVSGADISTDDGVNSSVDGMQIGASFDIGYAIKLYGNWNIEPTIGVHYNRIDYDDASDNADTMVSYDALQQFETEAGIKFEKFFISRYGISNLYLKPSVLQTYNDGNSAMFMGIENIATVEDDTFIRLELGGSIQYSPRWKLFGTLSNTFNGNYRDTSVNIGFNYNF